MYEIYVDHEKEVVKVGPLSKCFNDKTSKPYVDRALENPESVVPFNSSFYFCATRKVAVKEAHRILKEWINDYKQRIAKLESIKL